MEDMKDTDKAVLRFNDGRLMKGYLESFSADQPVVKIQAAETGKEISVNINELKAIFFVRSFEGKRGYHEKKIYGISRPRGHRVFIKFTDGEGLVGFLEGDVPWDKGFFLSKQDRTLKGFYLLPVDLDSNNIKVFVIASSVKDVTVVP